MTHPAIHACGLHFSYGKTAALSHVDFEISKGQFVGIIGPNGGGKTTLLKLAMGFLKPQKGSLCLLGKAPEQMRLSIGYVPQVSHTDRDFPITVLELVLLGAAGNRFGLEAEAKDKAIFLIEELGLGPHQTKAFSSLSGGLAQKALLARALLSDPDFLFLDEPTANIDPASRIAILEKLQELKGRKTILLITHDLKTVVEHVDKILCVQTQVDSYMPHEICGHFAMGLYHSPVLQDRKARPSERRMDALRVSL